MADVAGRHPHADLVVFAAVNHHGSEHAGLRVLQQAGTPWVLPATALVAGLGTGVAAGLRALVGRWEDAGRTLVGRCEEQVARPPVRWHRGGTAASGTRPPSNEVSHGRRLRRPAGRRRA